jgi:predicted DNA-binding transcriptional regulator AlpA
MIQFEPLFTIEELSNELSINKYTLYKKIRQNKFPKGVKIDGQRYWKPDEIKNHYNQMGVIIEISK